jgi:hypothetical protein
MKLKYLPHCIALSAGLLSGQHAVADGAFLWQDTSLS